MGLGIGTSAVPYNIQLALTLAVLLGSCDYFSPTFKIMLRVWETKESRPLSSWHIGSLQTLQAHHCSEQATQPPPPGDPGSSRLPISSTTGESRQTSESWAFPGPAAIVMVTGRHRQGRRCFGRNTCVSPALVLVTGTALAGVLGLIRLPRLPLILVSFLPRKGGNVQEPAGPGGCRGHEQPTSSLSIPHCLSQLRCSISSLQTCGGIVGIPLKAFFREEFLLPSFLHSFNKHYLNLHCIPVTVYKTIAYTEESQKFNIKNVSKGRGKETSFSEDFKLLRAVFQGA